MYNLNLPKWVKEAPQTFKCHLSSRVFNGINNDLKWYSNLWFMSTSNTSKWFKSPTDVIESAIKLSSVRVATDNYWNILNRNKSELAKQVGIPILTAHSLDYAGIGGIISAHVMDAIQKGDIEVIVDYRWKVGNVVFMPTIRLLQNGYPTRLDQNLQRAVKVTRAYHNIKDTQSRTKLKSLINQHCDYYYGPYVSAESYAGFTVPFEAINYMEK